MTVRFLTGDCIAHDRDAILIELNPAYAAIAVNRIDAHLLGDLA